ncbi:TRAP transporter small permease [Sagittula salina]|uniref:TRAP transporter small permease protein n=1 Tax=Sagittula salina TaxID=2820268 RepID=A0A940ML50_9RHOB|nr:TRAP transporter small permease subunit [Sagittula salina]MBP0483506.1 TRAP transporter small permease subunit [Sagittula salina]
MTETTIGAGRYRPARLLIEGWALLGGVALLGVVAINAWSILAGWIANAPFPGDFELTEMGTAIAVFAFLPYCQLTGANVSADIFTMRASALKVAAMSTLAALTATAFAGLLIWRMWLGLVDYRTYTEFTGILQIPIWWAFVPALISLVLLLAAALITLAEALAALRTTRST